MKLAAWLTREGKSGSDLAAQIGCDDATINRLIPKPGKKHIRRPGRRLMPKIVAATNGEVTANDFMDDVSEGDESPENGVQDHDPSHTEQIREGVS